MGLDITAYRKITPAPDAAVNEDGEPIDWQNHFWAHEASIKFTEENWPGHSDGVAPGIYTFAEQHRFPAGSYGGYNEWREWLARIAGWRSARECWEADDPSVKPFAELIHFADNEGVIGPKIAAKLAKDFAENQAKVGDVGWDAKLYAKWRKAFEMAADGGAVDFH